jgi:hypothetical protein
MKEQGPRFKIQGGQVANLPGQQEPQDNTDQDTQRFFSTFETPVPLRVARKPCHTQASYSVRGARIKMGV